MFVVFLYRMDNLNDTHNPSGSEGKHLPGAFQCYESGRYIIVAALFFKFGEFESRLCISNYLQIYPQETKIIFAGSILLSFCLYERHNEFKLEI